MNKNVNTWIEGNGTVRTVFRNMALWEYASPERSKQQLLRAIEKEGAHPSAYLLQYAIDKRKSEIQWASLYLPVLAFVAPILFVFYVLLLSHLALYLYLGIALILALSLVFKVTYFSQYQEACRFIYVAADSLLQETEKEGMPKETKVRPEIDLTDSVNFSPALSIGEGIQQDLIAMPLPEAEAIISPDIPESASKGSIAIVLLNELVHKECGRPNIYKGDTHKALAFYAHITGCQAKNLQGKLKYYKNREAINLSTANIRATHKKYLDILLDYYGETGDDILYNKAEDLQSFIENTANRQK